MTMKLHFKTWAAALLLTAIAPSLTASADANFPEDGHYYVLRNAEDYVIYKPDASFYPTTSNEIGWRLACKTEYTTPTTLTEADKSYIFKVEKKDDAHYYIKNLQTQRYLGITPKGTGYEDNGEGVGQVYYKENNDLLVEYHAATTITDTATTTTTTYTDYFTIRNDHFPMTSDDPEHYRGSYFWTNYTSPYYWLSAWGTDISARKLWKFEEVDYKAAKALDEASLPDDGYYVIRNTGGNFVWGSAKKYNWSIFPILNYTTPTTPTTSDMPYIFKVTKKDDNHYIIKNLGYLKYVAYNRNGAGTTFGFRNIGLCENIFDVTIEPIRSFTVDDKTYSNSFAIYGGYTAIGGVTQYVYTNFLHPCKDDQWGSISGDPNIMELTLIGMHGYAANKGSVPTTDNTFYFEKLSDQDAAAELDAQAEADNIDEVNNALEEKSIYNGNYYYITTNAGLEGQSLYTDVSATNPSLVYYGTSNQSGDPDRSEAKFIFKVTRDDATGHCTLKNIVNQKYIGCVGGTGSTANGLAFIKSTPYSLLIGYPDGNTSSLSIRADQAENLLAGDAIDVRSGGNATFLNTHTVYNKFAFAEANAVAIETAMQQVTIANSGFATAIFGYDAVVPDGVTVYTASQDNSSSVSLTKITEKVIPAGTAIVVSGTAGETYTFAVDQSTTDAAALAETNILKGNVTEETATTDETQTFYGLATGTDGKAVFKKVQAGVAVPAGKGYIVTTTSASSPEFLDLSGAATGISSAAADTHKDGRLYDLQGRRIEKPVKGVYIRDGKKVVIK